MCVGTAEDFSAKLSQQARSPLDTPFYNMRAMALHSQGGYSDAESGLHSVGIGPEFEQGCNSPPFEEGNASSGESSAKCTTDEGSTSTPVRFSNGSLELEWLQRPLSGGRDFEELGRLLSEEDWTEQESNARRVQRVGFAPEGGALNMGMSLEGGRASGGNSLPLKGDFAEEVRRGGTQTGEQGLAQPRVSRFRPPDGLFLPAKRRGANVQSFQPPSSFAPPFKGANSIPEGREVLEDAAMLDSTMEGGDTPWACARPADPPRTKLPRLGAKCAEDFAPLPMQNSLQRTQSDPAQWLQSYMPGDELVEDSLCPLPPPQMPPRPSPLQRHSSLPAARRGNPVSGGRLQRQRSAPQPEVMALLAEQILLELQQTEEAQKERLSVDQVQQMWDQASAPVPMETFQGGSSALQGGPQKHWQFGMQPMSGPQDFLYPTTPFVPQQAGGQTFPWAPQNLPLPEGQNRPPILRAFERITVPELPPGGSPTSALPCAPNESVLVPVGPNLAQVMKIFQDSKQPEVTSSFLVGAPMQAAQRASVPTWESMAFNECLLDLDSPSPFVGEINRRPQ